MDYLSNQKPIIIFGILAFLLIGAGILFYMTYTLVFPTNLTSDPTLENKLAKNPDDFIIFENDFQENSPTAIFFPSISPSITHSITPSVTCSVTPTITFYDLTPTVRTTSTLIPSFTPIPSFTKLPTLIYLPPTTVVTSRPVYTQPPPRACCKYCSTGKPCGNTCIARNKTCHVGPGCAC